MTNIQPGQAAFRAALQQIGTEAADRAWHHWQMLQLWQRQTNLTGVRGDDEALKTLYLDALVALPHWTQGALLDVGSGAGFPGLVLAMARPQAPVTLVEPRRKRALFLQHAVRELRLRHVAVLQKTVERMPTTTLFNVITLRAVFSADTLLAPLAELLKPRGRLLVFRRGPAPHIERAGALQRVAVHRYAINDQHAITPCNEPDGRRLDEWAARKPGAAAASARTPTA